jgi:hypothetical protein
MSVDIPENASSMLLQDEEVALSCAVKFPTENLVEECYFTNKRILKRVSPKNGDFGNGYTSILYKFVQSVSVRHYRKYSLLKIDLTGGESYDFNLENSESAVQAYQFVLEQVI